MERSLFFVCCVGPGAWARSAAPLFFGEGRRGEKDREEGVSKYRCGISRTLFFSEKALVGAPAVERRMAAAGLPHWLEIAEFDQQAAGTGQPLAIPAEPLG
jgi:hypothetical protein